MLEAEARARECATAEPSVAMAKSTNPLLVLLDEITDETVLQAIRSVVFEVQKILFYAARVVCRL